MSSSVLVRAEGENVGNIRRVPHREMQSIDWLWSWLTRIETIGGKGRRKNAGKEHGGGSGKICGRWARLGLLDSNAGGREDLVGIVNHARQAEESEFRGGPQRRTIGPNKFRGEREVLLRLWVCVG